MGLHKVGEDYYFFLGKSDVARNMSYYCWETHCEFKCDTYYFDADGKMLVNGVYMLEDGPYYFVNGKKATSSPGLTKIGEDYYFVSSTGRCAVGVYNCWATNCELPTGTYEFGTDAKMLNGFVAKDDGIYYYANGKSGPTGLIYVDGYYYFVTSNGRIIVSQTYYVEETNGLLPEKNYTFNELGQIVE